ncbi:MAG: ABC transporter permease [Candidatus Bathyarchaeia archaeon]
MKARRMLGMSWENMKQRRTRASLTTLGVVIGITAIIGLASLGEGFRIDMKNQLQTGFELDELTVIPGSLFAGYSREGFSDEQIANVSAVSGVKVSTGVMQLGNVTLHKDGKVATAFVATAVNFEEFLQVFPDRFNYESGGPPSSDSNDSIIIGYKANRVGEDEAEPFAVAGDKLTLTVGIPNPQVGIIEVNFTVTVSGTLHKEGTSGITNFDYWVFLPLETARELSNSQRSDLIFVKVHDPKDSERIANQIEAGLGEFKITILVPLAFIKQVDSILNVVQLFLLAVASISLIVAGIGIMNITMVSVMERTREIGILKAIGARNRTVQTIFLSEALLTGLIGGLIGIATGYGLSYLLSVVLQSVMQSQELGPGFHTPDEPRQLAVHPVFSPEWTVLAFVFAIVISVVFGWYPARKAARLDPVEALHYE